MSGPSPIDWSGPRKLLRELREVMRASSAPQEKLNLIADLIATDMVAEVCSIYLLRAGEVLELFATKGLKPEAVHRTRLRLGEGLVGDIGLNARPLALSDAQSHPHFAYRPETGEEIYHSLLGVPILRGPRVLGVLVVQNVSARSYSEEEVEALETVAMVLAEMVGGGELVSEEESRHSGSLEIVPARLTGLVLNEGIGMGVAVPHHRGLVISQVVAEDPAGELARLEEALSALIRDLDQIMERSELSASGEHRDVLETYRMFAEDKGWSERIRDQIRGGLTAEAAVERVQTDMTKRLAKVKDPYLRERYSDMQDLGHRLLQHLLGAGEAEDMPDAAILIAATMGPAELLDYDLDKIKAVVLEEGSPAAHVAIIARALGVPMVGRCNDLLQRVRPGDYVIVDASHGQVFLRPRAPVRASFEEALKAGEARKALFAATRDDPPVTRDGTRVSLNINAGLLVDLPRLHDSGADGIGLYRTEVPFMARNAFPNVADQRELYAKVLDLADGKPVTFRTLDVGGDKILPYWSGAAEENPALGWRAIRIGLDRPAMLRQQLRALIEAAAGRELRVMFPMVAEVAELKQAKKVLEIELARAETMGTAPPASVRVGTMLEVPALAWQLPALFREVDFVSIGSNDLFQFLFAYDRGNPALARRFDVLSPAALTFLRDLAHQAEAADVPLTLCGEMAGQPLEAMALLGCGFRSLSMPAPAIGEVKGMLRSLELPALQRLLGELIKQPDRSLRERLRNYAVDRQIAI